MDVKFVTSSINLGKRKSMADIIQGVTGAVEVKTASKDAEVKTAAKEDDEKECEACGKMPCECEEEKDCTAEAKVETKEAKVVVAEKEAEVDEEAEELVADEDAEAGDEQEKESKAKAEKKEADKKPKFVKVAKMTAENRTFLREFWLTMYPPDYVEAMLAEK